MTRPFDVCHTKRPRLMYVSGRGGNDGFDVGLFHAIFLNAVSGNLAHTVNHAFLNSFGLAGGKLGVKSKSLYTGMVYLRRRRPLPLLSAVSSSAILNGGNKISRDKRVEAVIGSGGSPNVAVIVFCSLAQQAANALEPLQVDGRGYGWRSMHGRISTGKLVAGSYISSSFSRGASGCSGDRGRHSGKKEKGG